MIAKLEAMSPNPIHVQYDNGEIHRLESYVGGPFLTRIWGPSGCGLHSRYKVESAKKLRITGAQRY